MLLYSHNLLYKMEPDKLIKTPPQLRGSKSEARGRPWAGDPLSPVWPSLPAAGESQ